MCVVKDGVSAVLDSILKSWGQMDVEPWTLSFYAMFMLGIMLLLGELPHGLKESARKGLEFVVCWCGMELISGAYFILLGDSYLNQIQEVLFVLLYGIFRSEYPVAKRFVMGSAGWAAETLIVSISGFSGAEFGLLTVMMMSASYGGVIWFLRRFAIEDFCLAPRYYVGGIIVMALFGAMSSANWRVEPGFQPYYLVLSAVLLVMLLLFYAMFYAINRSYSKNLELLAQQASLEAQQKLLVLSQKNVEEMKLLRHEIKNHDAYIEMLVTQHQYEELERYVGKRQGVLRDELQRIRCGNQVIDAAIDQGMAMAKLEGVQLEVRAAVPAKLSIQDSDLFALLSNLLSNAIESSAVADVPGPTVRIRLYQEREYLFIHMENPIDSSVEAAERLKLHTTKANRELHGYGTKVIQRIAEQYNGYVQYDIRGQQFISDLMLAATATEV